RPGAGAGGAARLRLGAPTWRAGCHQWRTGGPARRWPGARRYRAHLGPDGIRALPGGQRRLGGPGRAAGGVAQPVLVAPGVAGMPGRGRGAGAFRYALDYALSPGNLLRGLAAGLSKSGAAIYGDTGDGDT